MQRVTEAEMWMKLGARRGSSGHWLERKLCRERERSGQMQLQNKSGCRRHEKDGRGARSGQRLDDDENAVGRENEEGGRKRNEVSQ